ncbi:MAG TPA: sigma-54 dependent transcriptional regulator [Ktedonobacterales bacterium]|nr:sigma-54 dependent transcriptional regulator [Ktedonobacterales bacterium]
MAQPRALICDDDDAVREFLREVLEGEDYLVEEAATSAETLAKAQPGSPMPHDVILLDVKMEQDGVDVLKQLRDRGIEAPIIMMTAVAPGATAAAAIQNGAVDYLVKPFDSPESVAQSVARAVAYERLKQGGEEAQFLSVNVDPRERIIGVSPQMIEIFKLVGLVARTDTTVLITGETGTGKELISEAIHASSDRRNGPMIKINCAALPESLLESMLFGHEKGAFTGALAQHKGLFEVAHRGTILLDEIGEMSLSLQAKLLRVLQDHQFERVGGTEPVKVDVRVLAATNRDLKTEVRDRRFREDLFYRLDVIEIHMPPLREKREDIPLLVSHFLEKHRYSPRSSPARISQEAVEKMRAYDWPGNVRELENVTQRAVVLSQGQVITEEHISFSGAFSRPLIDVEQRVRAGATLADLTSELQREAATVAMGLNDNNPDKAARALAITTAELGRLVEMPAAVKEPA